MTAIFDALMRGVRDLFQAKVLKIVLWPVLAAAVLWGVLDLFFWDSLSTWLATTRAHSWFENIQPHWLDVAVRTLTHLLVYLMLVFITALLLTALFAMPALVRLVAEKDYPTLELKHGGGMAGSVVNALVALVIFVVIWVVTLPLWLIGAGVVMPFIAAAYLNQRLFRYDAVGEHADRDELRALFERYRMSWWGLGLITGFLQFVPFLNLFAPVLTGLVFIHFGLARLRALRAAVESGTPS